MRYIVAIDHEGTHTMALSHNSSYHPKLIAEKSIYPHVIEYVAIVNADDREEAQEKGLATIREHFPEALTDQ